MRHTGELAEWSNAAVLKTVEGYTSGGSNPSFSAKKNLQQELRVFCFQKNAQAFRLKAFLENKKLSYAFLAWRGFFFAQDTPIGITIFVIPHYPVRAYCICPKTFINYVYVLFTFSSISKSSTQYQIKGAVFGACFSQFIYAPNLIKLFIFEGVACNSNYKT